jgi:hypothetical protein
LAGRHKAPWKWIPPSGLMTDHGTAVQLKLHNALSPLLDEGFLEGTLRRQYQPLLEPAFDEMLAAHYPKGFRFEVNGRVLERQPIHGVEVSKLAICLARKRKPSAVGYLARSESLFPEDQRGMAVSTFGKVIKRGWDWLGITPAAPDRMAGMIEAPALAAALTLNKGDFVRVGTRGALYLGYRKAIQEAVSQQLAHWGDVRELGDRAGRRAVRPMERDLETVLVDLAEEFPLLASLVERRAGGQKRLPIGQSSSMENGQGFLAASVMSGAEAVEDGMTPPEAAQDPGKERRSPRWNLRPESLSFRDQEDGRGRVIMGSASGSNHMKEIRTLAVSLNPPSSSTTRIPPIVEPWPLGLRDTILPLPSRWPWRGWLCRQLKNTSS